MSRAPKYSRLDPGQRRDQILDAANALFAERGSFPAVLSATAETEDGVIMAIEHKSLPIAAVQFHPESVMTSPGEIGMPILETALSVLCEKVAA